MLKKKMTVAVLLVMLICVFTGCSNTDSSGSSGEKAVDISSGSLTGTELKNTYSLEKADGKYVNFRVNNTGVVPVVITINGDKDKTLQPGENGNIYDSVSFLKRKFTFQAVPGQNGGAIGIDYEITQGDTH